MSIRSLGDAATERLFRTGRSRNRATIAKVALRKLDMLDAAETLADLRAPPGKRLEALPATAQDCTASASTTSSAFAFT